MRTSALVLTSLLAVGGVASPAAAQETAPAGESARVVSDVHYAPLSASQVLDVVQPDQQQGAAPLVVMVHGGAFEGGGRRDADIEAAVGAFVAQGFVAASVEYRKSGEAQFPAAVQDVKAAVRYLRAHADEYGIDPGRIAIMGDSAGGYLAAMAGTTSGTGQFDDPALGNADTSSAVQAVVDRYGPTDFASMNSQAVCGDGSLDHDGPGSPESRFLGTPVPSAGDLVRAADPASHVSGSTPPFLIEHGTADCLVPPGQSEHLHAALQGAGRPSTLNLLEGFSHADSRFDQRNDATAAWVQSILGGGGKG